MDEYVKKGGYSNRSAMLRQAFRTFRKIYPLQNTEKEYVSIEEHFRRIEKRLEELKLEQKVLENDEELLNNRENRLNIRENEIDQEISKIFPIDIPNLGKIAENLIQFINSFPNKSVKDFVLMDQFRNAFPEAYIWAVLVNLKNRKILKLKNGAWMPYTKK